MCQVRRPALAVTNVISPITARSSLGRKVVHEVNKKFQQEVKSLAFFQVEKSPNITVEKSSQSLSDFLT